MKKVSLVFFVIVLLLSACQSKEEKANEMIKEELYKTLYDFSSYEPIETTIDSAFTSIYKDSTILYNAILLQATMKLADEKLEEIRDAFSSIEIWQNSYSSYGRRKFYELREKIEEDLEEAKVYQKLMNEITIGMKKEIDKFEPTFYGFQATHRFRCKTKGGNFTLADYLYIFDEDFKTILSKTDLDNEDEKKLRSLIDEVKDSIIEEEEGDGDDDSNLL